MCVSLIDLNYNDCNNLYGTHHMGNLVTMVTVWNTIMRMVTMVTMFPGCYETSGRCDRAEYLDNANTNYWSGKLG